MNYIYIYIDSFTLSSQISNRFFSSIIYILLSAPVKCRNNKYMYHAEVVCQMEYSENGIFFFLTNKNLYYE